MATANPTFRGLPRELRDEVYRHLVVSNRQIIHCPVRGERTTSEDSMDSSDSDGDRKREFEEFWRKIMTQRRPKKYLPTAILRVSREIHYEAQQIMLRENTFVIDFRALAEHRNGAQDLFPQEVLKQAFRLHIIADNDMWRILKVAKFLELDTCFRSLHLEFRRGIASFLRPGQRIAVDEEWREPMDQALCMFCVLKKMGVQNVKVSNWTGFSEQTLRQAPESLRRRIKITEDFAKKLEAEMRKNFWA